MTRLPSNTFSIPSPVLAALYIAFATIVLIACSNSEPMGSNGNDVAVIDYLPLDDTEYPYAGIPRIVIETENHHAIKDRETEIPARLQIWGEKTPKSKIMTLTIRGRGNTSWEAPKKSYKIEFINKQSILGMPEDRDWALISNYADKALMKNYLMYHLAAKMGAYYAPRCEFAELYINNEYLGVYLLTETIKIGKTRINIPSNNSYLVEIDTKYRENEQIVFSRIIKKDSIGKPFRIHEPRKASKESLSTIEKHIIDFESHIIKIKSQTDNHLNQLIDINEYIKHYWVQEFAKNPDANFYTSVYFSWTKDDLIRIGPVWDFDIAFGSHWDDARNIPENWHVKGAYWNYHIFRDSIMEFQRKNYWVTHRNFFLETINTIDSVHNLLQDAADNNFKRWDILQSTSFTFHRKAYSTHTEAAEDLKNWISERIKWIDEKIGTD